MNQCIERINQIIREKKDKIKAHLDGLTEVSIVSDNLLSFEMKEIENRILKGNISDSELLSFIDNGIRMVELTADVFTELKELIPKDIEKLIIPGTIFKTNSKMSDFPELKEFISSSYLGLDINSLQKELTKVIRMDFPTEGKLGELFKKDFIVSYLHAWLGGLDRVEVFDRRNKTDSFTEVIGMSLNSNKVINSLTISSLSIDEIILIFEWLKNEKYEVGDVTLVLENKSISNIKLLEKYLNDFNILIDYGEYKKTNYEGFVTMRATIDWYKNIITTCDLSPFEQLIFAYDILKTFAYREGNKPEDSRYVPDILTTGNIVCVGYSKILQMLVNELGIKAVCIFVGKEGAETSHERVVVRLDDNKYDIHGVFAVDATWDRGVDELSLVKNSDGYETIRCCGIRSGDRVIKKYDALTLYNFFLIPYCDYKKIFWDEKLPDIFRIFEEDESGYNIFASCRAELKNLFDDAEKGFIRNCIFKSKKPSLESFMEALSVVRKAEGYVADEVPMLVDDTIVLNQMLDESGVFFIEEGINKK